jgi:acyl carrier protein
MWERYAMSNESSYARAFVETLGVDETQLAGLEYGKVNEWDSVGHMALVAALEETFDIMMDTDDIIDLSSFEKGKEILRKYDVEL